MSFTNYKIHPKLLSTLTANNYTTPTMIQSETLPHTLISKNIVASSRTGTGKTLAFTIPLINKLLQLKWTSSDELGALILSPTRELAVQTYELVRKLIENTSLTASTLIGGVESASHSYVGALSIIVATPGRILQHLQENDRLNTANLQCLVLDEADKMVEAGFKEDLEFIVEYLNSDRQTMLFCATPCSIALKIKNIVSDYEILGMESEKMSGDLKQYFYNLEMKDKIEVLYDILKNNYNTKCVVFFSTCKEVKFFYLLFSKLVRTEIYFLNGNMKQDKRLRACVDFSNAKSAFLFCTDVGARGLDFEGVDLVLQYDCPENVETYVHRIGRTARNGKEGVGVLLTVGGEKIIVEEISKGKWARSGVEKSKKMKGGNKKVDTANKTACDDKDENKSEADKKTKIDETKSENTTLIKERKLKKKISIKEKVQNILADNIEIEVFAGKYIKTYTKFIQLGNKKYYKDSILQISQLTEYFNTNN